MKPFSFILCIVLLALMSCNTTKNTVTQAQIEALKTLVENKQFRIESNWAYPQATNAMQQVVNTGILGPGNSANAISLIGNSNFLSISNDSITSYLPYFGERQMQVAYGGGDNAIEFSGVLKNYKVEINKDHSYMLSFEAKSKSEHFKVYITINPNFSSYMQLSGSSRFPISYAGNATGTK